MKKNFTKLLDASGELCPKPILLARQALKNLASGEVLKIISTDSQSSKDFEIFCKIKNFKLFENPQEKQEKKCNIKNKFVFYITK